jgi:aspartate aminotransferase
MPLALAERLGAIAPSATLAMAAEAQKLTARGVRVFPFSVGEPDFPTPGHIIEAAKLALDRGATRYTHPTGTPELKQAVCDATKKHRGFDVTPDRVVVSCGAKHALFNVAAALYGPGDEVIVPAPYWVSYPEQVRLFGATAVIADTDADSGFALTPEELERRITPRTKALILCSPSNPTGAAYSREQLLALAEVVRRHSFWVVVDEIYADLVYGGFEHHSLATLAPDLSERLIVIDGVSKSFAMTGWRIGWSIAPPALSKALGTIQSQSTTNPAAVSQAAAVAALTGPRDALEAMRQAFEKRRGIMVDGLNALPGVRASLPVGAFYAFPEVRQLIGKRFRGQPLESDLDVAMFFLREAHAAVVAGEPFGAPGFMRLSYACADTDIVDGLASMRSAIEQLEGDEG